MVVHSCQHFSVVAPCSLRSRRRLLAAACSHYSSLRRISAGPSPRSPTVCFSSTEQTPNPPEEPPKDAEEDGEEPHQHKNEIKKEDAAFGPRVRLSSVVTCLFRSANRSEWSVVWICNWMYHASTLVQLYTWEAIVHEISGNLCIVDAWMRHAMRTCTMVHTPWQYILPDPSKHMHVARDGA